MPLALSSAKDGSRNITGPFLLLRFVRDRRWGIGDRDDSSQCKREFVRGHNNGFATIIVKPCQG